MADEVVLKNKAAIIERCLERIREEYVGHEDELGRDYPRQDAIVLNLLWGFARAMVERVGEARRYD